MGLWRDHVLPRAVDRALDDEECAEHRRAIVAGLRGMVLELGFGSGLNLPWLPETVTRLVAVDPAVVGRKLARARLAACPIPVDFVDLHGDDLALEDASVDAVLSTWTLCTVPDAAATLAEVRRVLKPGGRLHFVEHGVSPDPDVARWQRRLNGFQRWWAGGCELIRPIDALIVGAGLRLERLTNAQMRKGPRVAGYLYEGVAVRDA